MVPKTATHVNRLFVVTPFPVRLLRLSKLFFYARATAPVAIFTNSLVLRNQDVFIIVQSWLTVFVFVLLVQRKMELQFTHCLLHQSLRSRLRCIFVILARL